MSVPRRLEELLAERATQGLASAERRELSDLLAANPEVDNDDFDLAAAALHLALTPEIEPMPSHLRGLVLDRSRRELAGPLAPVADFAAEKSRRRPAEPDSGGRWAPWLVAAAALVIAVIGWWPRPGTGPEVAVAADETPSIETVAAAADAIRWAWSGTEDVAVAEAGGEVVWSGDEQRGFMRIRGLAANDPRIEQYQLWIFDRAGDERYPVDGGVFDVSAEAVDGEVLVPIDAKIAVGEPYLFAVTVEKPGGVVVSSRERIVLLAQA